MSEQFQGKILAAAALAALIGMDGLFSMIDHEIRGAGHASAIHAQSSQTENVVMRIPQSLSQPICEQNEWSFFDQLEFLNNEDADPLVDEDFEHIEWNEDQEDILRNASNSAFDRLELHRPA